MALLEVSNLGIAFGGLQAVDKVDLTVEEGALCGLIGPNGAGKTTVFNMLTGVYSPTEGYHPEWEKHHRPISGLHLQGGHCAHVSEYSPV